jgi:hypothetical protein
MTPKVKGSDAKSGPSNYWERFRLLIQKHPVQEVVRHLPTLAEILVRATGGDLAGVLGGILRAIGGFGDARTHSMEPAEAQLRSILSTQEQLAIRCETLEKVNENIRGEVAVLADQNSTLRNEVQKLEAAIESLRNRNTYLAWSVLIAFLLACSAFAWKFAH